MSSEAGKIHKSLAINFKIKPENQQQIRTKLNAETAAQGLKSVGLAELTGWSTSKTSKITAGRQNLTADDVKKWARVLGYTPDPFFEENVDLRYYQLSNYVRKFDVVLEDYLETDEREEAFIAMAEYEMPLSLIMMLSLKASDYVINTRVGGWLWNEDSVGPTWLILNPRGINTGEKPIPRFGVFINEQRDMWAIITFIDETDTVKEVSSYRAQYKEELNIPDEDTELFDDSDILDKSWLPENVLKGEIASYASGLAAIMDYKSMQDLFLAHFKHYCDLVYTIAGVDLIPNVIKRIEDEDRKRTGLIFSSMLAGGGFFSDVETSSRKKNNYSCEISKEHQSFIGEDEKPFVEVVPLVPFMEGGRYGQAIKSEANAVCLCPNCSAQLEYGRREDREQMLFSLFKKHSAELKKMGIDITLRELLEAHQL